MVYEITITCPRPQRPDEISDRMWTANLDRLGFVVGGKWYKDTDTIRAVLDVKSDEGRITEGYRYRTKDSSWAIEQALRWWRGEMWLLLNQEERRWDQPIEVSCIAI